eukprot:8144949-Pyramimonas_sp.AAC.1
MPRNPTCWKLSWRKSQPCAIVSNAVVGIVLGDSLCGATTRVTGVTPQNVSGVRRLGPSVELPTGP